MKLASISNDFFKLFSDDKELLHNKENRRPYLIIIKLKYKGKKQDFAIPFRSHISKYIPKEQYFSLPPRPKTKHNEIHGLHYIKMFPIKKKFLEKFSTNKDKYYKIIVKIINKNQKKIIKEAQSYLSKYEEGRGHKYSPNIEYIFEVINSQKLFKEVATTNED
jgi:hypothetical protein